MRWSQGLFSVDAVYYVIFYMVLMAALEGGGGGGERGDRYHEGE